MAAAAHRAAETSPTLLVRSGAGDVSPAMIISTGAGGTARLRSGVSIGAGGRQRGAGVVGMGDLASPGRKSVWIMCT